MSGKLHPVDGRKYKKIWTFYIERHWDNRFAWFRVYYEDGTGWTKHLGKAEYIPIQETWRATLKFARAISIKMVEKHLEGGVAL